MRIPACIAVVALKNSPSSNTFHSRRSFNFRLTFNLWAYSRTAMRHFRMLREFISCRLQIYNRTLLRSPCIQLILTLTGTCKRGEFTKRNYSLIYCIDSRYLDLRCLSGMCKLWISRIIIPLSTKMKNYTLQFRKTNGWDAWHDKIINA